MTPNDRTDRICSAKKPQRIYVSKNMNYDEGVRRYRNRIEAYADSYIMVDCGTIKSEFSLKMCQFYRAWYGVQMEFVNL